MGRWFCRDVPLPGIRPAGGGRGERGLELWCGGRRWEWSKMAVALLFFFQISPLIPVTRNLMAPIDLWALYRYLYLDFHGGPGTGEPDWMVEGKG